MTTAANVATITKIYEAFGKGEVPYIIDQLSDDVRWVSHLEPIVPWGGERSGKANVPSFFQAINDSVDVESFVPGEFIAEGDTVVSLGTFGCRVKATGKTANTAWVFIWKVQDGVVTSYEQFHDPEIADAFR